MAWYRCGMNGTYRSTTVSRSGAVCNYVANVGGVPLSRFIANITPIQEGSGDPSPINPRAINGVNKVQVCDTPMPVSQLWTIDSSFNGMVNFNQLLYRMRATGAQNGLTFTRNNDGLLTITGTVTTAFNYNRVLITSNDYIDFVRDGRKYLILLSKAIPFNIGVNGYDASGLSGSLGYIFTRTDGGVWSNGISALMPLNSAVDITDLRISVFDLTTMFGSTIADYIYSLEQATAGAGVAFFKSIYPEDYYEYDAGTNEMVGSREGQTATINLGGTYYGGTLNVGTGLLTVTHVNIASYNGESINEPWLCSEAPYIPNTTPPTGSQVVYPLTTPQTYQLTPTQLTQLLGENNVWCDSGDSEVDFFKIIRT